jgi:hypothetical protein
MLTVVALVGVAVTAGMGGVEGMSVESSGAKSVATTAKTGASIVRNVASIGGKRGPERDAELSLWSSDRLPRFLRLLFQRGMEHPGKCAFTGVLR